MLWWIGVAIVALVFLDLLFVEVRRIVIEARRIQRRLAAYGDLPIFSLAASAEFDVERMTASLDAVEPLMERGRAAIATIRTGGRTA